MAKRDRISEIKQIKSRAEFNSRYAYSIRLSDIEYALQEFIEYNGDLNHELLKYIPISIIACFEAFFRSTVSELIDFGKPFSTNAAKFNQSNNTKLDFEIIFEIQTKTLTNGEFVAHLLSYNNYDDINSNLTILIGEDFTTRLKKFKANSIFEIEESDLDDFQKQFPDILKSIKRTYELRHIFCHEFATNVKIDEREIRKNFNNCKIFLTHVNNFIWELLYPNAPQTQAEMNILANNKFAEKDEELEKLILFIKDLKKKDYSMGSFEENKFDESINKWNIYRESYAEHQACYVEGGSMYPTIYASNLESITKEKIKLLEKDFEILLRRNGYIFTS